MLSTLLSDIKVRLLDQVSGLRDGDPDDGEPTLPDGSTVPIFRETTPDAFGLIDQEMLQAPGLALLLSFSDSSDGKKNLSLPRFAKELVVTIFANPVQYNGTLNGLDLSEAVLFALHHWSWGPDLSSLFRIVDDPLDLSIRTDGLYLYTVQLRTDITIKPTA
ncbi:MAG: hypothetical protein AAGJ81_08130 [Verrucomicrobiota bacterium]